MNAIIKYDIRQLVSVREYKVDTSSLSLLLKSKRKERNLSINKISEMLGLPKTKVEHFFKNDSSFAIPSPDIWIKLKEILHISTREYDKAICNFVTKENIFDHSNRIYDEEGMAPTLTLTCGNDYYLVRDYE